jgi:hypothetical protein
MKVKIEVVLDVEFCEEDLGDPKPGDPIEDRILDSVQEAVSNALHAAQANGFSHDLEDELSVMVSNVGPAQKV